MHSSRGVEDALVRDFMTGTWSSFAKSGNPAPLDTDEMTTKWLRTTVESKLMLDISGSSPEMYMDEGIKRRMDFWMKLMAE